jgi:tRNA (guanine37-N1)-methyltransferase
MQILVLMGLPEDLAGHIPEAARRLVPRRYDVVGDIAILSLRGELREYGPEIAEVIIKKRRHIRTVLNKAAMIRGENRLASYEILAGLTTITTHREYGIPYRLDLSRVFFNPSLASERNRVAAQVVPGETVLVPFAGIGPFVLPLAKKGSFVVAVENNPDAVRWLTENILLNDAGARVSVVEGNAFDPALYGNLMYDRAVIPAPYGMDRILGTVYPVVRSHGVIHFYTFRKDAEIPGLIASFLAKGLKTARWQRCGNVAPGVCRFVFDLVKMKCGFSRSMRSPGIARVPAGT